VKKEQRIVGLVAAALGAAALLVACATSPPPPKTVVRESGKPGEGFPQSEDYYPAAAQRLAESGRVVVLACVGVDGELTAEPTIATSSGSTRLDEGALRLARAGSGHYRPATENGKPVKSCFVFAVVFALKAPESPAAAPGVQGAPAPHP